MKSYYLTIILTLLGLTAAHAQISSPQKTVGLSLNSSGEWRMKKPLSHININEDTVENRHPYYHSIGVFGAFGSDYFGASMVAYGLSYKYMSFDVVSFLPGVELAYTRSTNIDDIGIIHGLYINMMGGVNLRFSKHGHYRLLGHGTIATNFHVTDFFPGVTVGAGATLWRVEGDIDLGIKSGFPWAQASVSYIFTRSMSLIPG
ncbi:MAG: hypothetical protein M3Q97_02850 [Bacteroidota bacterium]|nr:hypothetical protein [Bacteroidota bacterium]